MLNTIIKSDAYELLQSLDNESTDLIILDPNYQDWQEHIENGLIELALSKLKDSGNIILFTKKPYDYELRKYINPYYRNEIIWKYMKTGNWVSKKLPTYTYQNIYWILKNKHIAYFSPRTGMPYSKKTVQGNKGYLVFDGYREKSKDFSNSEDGVWLSDFLHIERRREGNGNIPTKPIKLCQIIVRCFSDKGHLVVDPFCGGGNVAKVAKDEGRNFICGDIDQYCVSFSQSKIENG